MKCIVCDDTRIVPVFGEVWTRVPGFRESVASMEVTGEQPCPLCSETVQREESPLPRKQRSDQT